jgi:hypothetical protein
MQAFAASCEELRARTGKPPLEREAEIESQACEVVKDAVQSDLRMCTRSPLFIIQTVYLRFYFILCSCKA